MSDEQKKSLRTILLGVYVKGIMREPIDTADFVEFSLQEVLKVLSSNEKE